jgi:hypothetical protein
VQEEAYINPSLFCLSNVNPVRVVMIKLEQYDRHPTVLTHARANPARVVLTHSVAPPTPATAVNFFTQRRWPVFRHFILVAIVVNCILLTYEDPVCKCAAGMGQDKCTEREFFLRVSSLGHGAFCFESPLCHCACVLLHVLLIYVVIVVLQTLYVGAFGSDSSSIGIDCGSQEQKDSMLWVGEIVFTIIFLVEMLIKIIARGFFMHKHAYLRDRMNWLDFVVVGAGTTSVTLQLMALPPNNFTQVESQSQPFRMMQTICRQRRSAAPTGTPTTATPFGAGCGLHSSALPRNLLCISGQWPWKAHACLSCCV